MKSVNSDLTIVTGGINSGKSLWAENLLLGFINVTYVATYQYDMDDLEMKNRVSKHRLRRSKEWKTIESKGNLVNELKKIPRIDSILIDSLGGFVTSNIDLTDHDWSVIELEFLYQINQLPNKIIIVSEEVGLGIVPINRIGRIFIDRIGALSQKLGQVSNSHWLIVQGKAINLTNIGISIK